MACDISPVAMFKSYPGIYCVASYWQQERGKSEVSMNVEEKLLFRKTKFQILQKITFSHGMSIVAGSTTLPLMGMKGQKNDPNHTFTKPLKLNIFFCATPLRT